MLTTKAINFLLEREQLCIYYLTAGWEDSQFSGSRYFPEKYPFFQKSAALFPQLQQAQALNGKIENNFLTLLVENYCQGMGQVSPLQDSCWSIALFS